MTQARTLAAFNTATESENKIHDDEVAARFGFTGGLVPGVELFAYMTQPPRLQWGQRWLEGGAMRAKFIRPIYDGDDVTASLDDEGALTLSARGEVCATGWARERGEGPAPSILPAAALPARRPQATMASLPPGKIMGSLAEYVTTTVSRAQLQETRDDLGAYEGGAVMSPGFMLRRANSILAANVVLGPWIHAESEIRLHGQIRNGEVLETRAIVRENREKNGHLIAVFDFTMSTGDRLLMSGRHWAIYEPRQVREKAQAA